MNSVINAEQEAVLRGSALKQRHLFLPPEHPDPPSPPCGFVWAISSTPPDHSPPHHPMLAQHRGLPLLTGTGRLQAGEAGGAGRTGSCSVAIWGHQTHAHLPSIPPPCGQGTFRGLPFERHFGIKGNLVGTRGASRAWALRRHPG